MSVDSGREQDRYTWRPGRGYAGGAVTGLWFVLVLAALTVVIGGVRSGWQPALALDVAAELFATAVVAVPVLALVGGALRAAARLPAIGAYAAASLVTRVLLGPLVESAVGASTTPTGAQTAVLAVTSVLAGLVAAAVSTRDRLPRTSGRLRYRAGGPPTAGDVPGPSSAPAPAQRYLSGGA